MSKSEKSERTRSRDEKTEKKLLEVFSSIVPELGMIAEDTSLSQEELSECIRGLNFIHQINGGVRPPGWPCVQLFDFLSVQSSSYKKQLALIHDLRIDTSGRFFKLSLSVMLAAFQEREVRFPKVLEVLHAEFRKKDVRLSEIPLTDKQKVAWKTPLRRSRHWLQKSERT